jgi:hypothetical protein
MWLGGADDGGADAGVVQYPGEGDLGHADAALFGDVLHRMDDGFVGR